MTARVPSGSEKARVTDRAHTYLQLEFRVSAIQLLGGKVETATVPGGPLMLWPL
jgi:hypothetical protein